MQKCHFVKGSIRVLTCCFILKDFEPLISLHGHWMYDQLCLSLHMRLPSRCCFLIHILLVWLGALVQVLFLYRACLSIAWETPFSLFVSEVKECSFFFHPDRLRGKVHCPSLHWLLCAPTRFLSLKRNFKYVLSALNTSPLILRGSVFDLCSSHLYGYICSVI